MSQIRYVVASLPRSGTKYISKVLSDLGLNCAHEGHFTYRKCELELESGPEVWGDASWMSVPYIDKLPPGTVVFHQIRDPIKVLNSNLPPGGDSYFRTWDEHAGLPSDPLYNKPIPWKRFIWEHTQDWVWPGGTSPGIEGPGEIARLIHWWLNWNLWIEYATLRRNDLLYIRYRLEDMTPDLLRDIASIIQPDAPLSPRASRDKCAGILSSTSTTLNRHRTPNDKVTVEMLPPAAQLLTYRYGYHDTIQVAQV